MQQQSSPPIFGLIQQLQRDSAALSVRLEELADRNERLRFEVIRLAKVVEIQKESLHLATFKLNERLSRTESDFLSHIEDAPRVTSSASNKKGSVK